MPDWRPGDYLQFGNERTRPSLDLAAHVAVEHPGTVVDLGCGPGNSTQVLAQRWPAADLIGVDESPEVIASARAAYPQQDWVQVAPGGALAFQVPSTDFALLWTLIREVAQEGEWAARRDVPLRAVSMESPAFSYDRLAPRAKHLDIWQTEYVHVLDSPDAVVDWISSTGLRPFLDVLETDEQSERFVARLTDRVHESYLRRGDGKVLFPFKRTFVIAYAWPAVQRARRTERETEARDSSAAPQAAEEMIHGHVEVLRHHSQ